ncbi:MAG TPA: metallophosphoesterase [Paracoccaceae bacterium]|nr:metallophosphoesterase [Paracoccaceae bacterium]
MPTRRVFLRTSGAALLGSLALGARAVAGTVSGPRIARHALRPRGWPAGFSLRIAALSDFHACEPWMSAERIADIAAATNQLRPDIVLLLGDYVSNHRWITRKVPAASWAEALAGLRAPLGVHAILGNHDWTEDLAAQRSGGGPVFARLALEAAGIPVYENDVLRLAKDGHGFWLAGLADQRALPLPTRWGKAWRGLDDLDGTLAKVTDAAPLILMAHEPDIFPRVPERVALTLSGHTHAGQIRFFGWAPVVPSVYGSRYLHGHIVEAGPGGLPRDLIVSAGLGCSGVPLRIGAPPEITLVELSG